jgi:polysaccharide biosynthesis transport protein
MERAQQLRILWSYKWWLLLFAIAAAVAAYLISNSRDPVYSASALAQIVSSRQAAGEQLSEDELLSLTNVYVELASTDTVERIAHRDERVGESEDFDSSVSVEPQQRVGVLDFTAETGDAETAADWANAYADAFVVYTERLQGDQRDRALDRIQQRIDEIQTELEERGVGANDPSVAGLTAELEALQAAAAEETAAPGDTVRVIEQAVADDNPISPKPLRDALLVLLGALIIGAIAAYVREALVDRFSSPEEASADLGVPILGEIPKASPDVPVREAFRRLRTAVVVALESSGSAVAAEHGWTVLVTGAEPGSGKSFVSSNLARALAAEGWKVIAIDGDLRRPTLHDQFEVPREPGLGDLLTGSGLEQYPERVAFEVSSSATEAGGRGELRALTAGPYIEDSVERFSSQRMADVVERLKELNDFVVIDSPPALAVVDPVVLARHSDGVIIVIDSRKTKRRDARRAVQTMHAIGTPVLGMVYNRSEAPVGGYYSYDALGAGLEAGSGARRVRGAAR